MDPTQLAGIGAFGGAALACFCVRQRSWLVIGAINAGLALECVLSLRHRKHDIVLDVMGAYYDTRTGVQIGLIIVALLIVLGGTIILLRRKSRAVPPAVLATTGLALALFSVETISLHVVDAFFYQTIAGLLLIGWMWIALGLITAIGALRAISRRGNVKA